MAARGMEAAFRMLEGQWKIVIVFHLLRAVCYASLSWKKLFRAPPRRC